DPTAPGPSTKYRVRAVSAAGQGGFCPGVPVDDPPVVIPQDPCQAPGFQVTIDPSGDQTGAPANGGLDLKSAFIAEPWDPEEPADDDLEFRIQTHTSLDPLPPPNGFWYVYFTYRGVNYYVAMTTGDTPVPSYEYGRIDVDPVSGLNDQTQLGTIADGSVSGDTILIRLSRGLLTEPVTIGGPGQPAPVQGDLFTNVRGETRLLIGGGGTGLIAVIDDSTPSEYEVRTNEACAPNASPTARLSGTPQSGIAPLQVTFNASASTDPDAGDTIIEYTFDFGDGTPPVTQASATVDHTYTEPGNYHANLTVKDSRGKESTNTAGVVVTVLPEGDYYTVLPCRLLDTRSGPPVSSNTDRVLDVDSVTPCGVSPLATAVAINVTVIQPTAMGHLTAYPGDLAQPSATSTLNFNSGIIRGNNALVRVSGDGVLKLRPVMSGGGSAHVVVDVVGFFIADP
ncbi:MAG TPA: PKD domain-containing protein, partial [Thermoanaerobaculia bacterium]|nr:PKD domain-containing protein [Thermoanaerobaculia bacterium]